MQICTLWIVKKKGKIKTYTITYYVLIAESI